MSPVMKTCLAAALSVVTLASVAQADGGCAKRPRIFDKDSSYSFDATETEPPNTNSFFGPGGYAVWASDNNKQQVRGCIIIASGLGSDVSKCLDMTFQ